MSDDRKVTAKRLRKMVDNQGGQCFLSGRLLKPETSSADHMRPVSRGGENTIDNICIVDADINQAKGTQTVSEFLAMCREVVAWADRNRDAEDE
jgi:CRISPR/Cas system Type II protein with McrA/HNH and RuvC-like nuclease domain